MPDSSTCFQILILERIPETKGKGSKRNKEVRRPTQSSWRGEGDQHCLEADKGRMEGGRGLQMSLREVESSFNSQTAIRLLTARLDHLQDSEPQRPSVSLSFLLVKFCVTGFLILYKY